MSAKEIRDPAQEPAAKRLLIEPRPGRHPCSMPEPALAKARDEDVRLSAKRDRGGHLQTGSKATHRCRPGAVPRAKRRSGRCGPGRSRPYVRRESRSAAGHGTRTRRRGTDGPERFARCPASRSRNSRPAWRGRRGAPGPDRPGAEGCRRRARARRRIRGGSRHDAGRGARARRAPRGLAPRPAATARWSGWRRPGAARRPSLLMAGGAQRRAARPELRPRRRPAGDPSAARPGDDLRLRPRARLPRRRQGQAEGGRGLSRRAGGRRTSRCSWTPPR